MALEPFQYKLIKLYKEQELLMSSLYEQLAVRFPKYDSKFRELAAEELEHAGWIQHLEQCIQNGTASFSEGKTRTYTITTLMNYMQSIVDSLKKGNISLLKAVSLTFDTEKSFIERNVFERFAGDSEEVDRILRILETTQRDHLSRIEQFVAQIKQDLGATG